MLHIFVLQYISKFRDFES